MKNRSQVKSPKEGKLVNSLYEKLLHLEHKYLHFVNTCTALLEEKHSKLEREESVCEPGTASFQCIHREKSKLEQDLQILIETQRDLENKGELSNVFSKILKKANEMEHFFVGCSKIDNKLHVKEKFRDFNLYVKQIVFRREGERNQKGEGTVLKKIAKYKEVISGLTREKTQFETRYTELMNEYHSQTAYVKQIHLKMKEYASEVNKMKDMKRKVAMSPRSHVSSPRGSHNSKARSPEIFYQSHDMLLSNKSFDAHQERISEVLTSLSDTARNLVNMSTKAHNATKYNTEDSFKLIKKCEKIRGGMEGKIREILKIVWDEKNTSHVMMNSFTGNNQTEYDMLKTEFKEKIHEISNGHALSLNKILDKVEEKIGSVIEIHEALSSRISGLKDRNSDIYKDEINHLLSENSSLSRNVQLYIDKYNEIIDKNLELEDTQKELLEELTEKTNQLAEITDKYVQKTDELNHLKTVAKQPQNEKNSDDKQSETIIETQKVEIQSLKKKMASLEWTLDQKQRITEQKDSEIEQINRLTQHLEEEYDAVKTDYETLLGKYNAKQSEVSYEISDYIECQECLKLKEELSYLQTDSDCIKEFTKKFTEIQEEYIKLKKQYFELDKLLQRVKAENTSLKEELEENQYNPRVEAEPIDDNEYRLSTSSELVEFEVRMRESQMSHKSSEIHALNSIIIQLEDYNESMHQQIEENITKNSEAKQEMFRIKEENTSLTVQFTKELVISTDLQEETERLNELIMSKDKDYTDLKRKDKERELALSELKDFLKTQEHAYSDLEKSKKRCENEVKLLTSTLTTLQKESENFASKNTLETARLQEGNSALKGELEEQRICNRELYKQNEDLKSLLAQMKMPNSHSTEINSLNADIKDRQGRIEDLFEEIERLKKIIKERNNTENSLKHEIKTLSDSNNNLDQQVQQYSKELESLSQNNREYQKVKKELESLIAESQTINKDNTVLRESLVQLSNENSSLHKEIDGKTELVSELKIRVKEKTTESLRFQELANALTPTNSSLHVELQQKSSEFSRSLLEVAQLTHSLSQSKTEIENKNIEIVQLKSQIEHLSSLRETLQSELDNLGSSSKQQTAELSLTNTELSKKTEALRILSETNQATLTELEQRNKELKRLYTEKQMKQTPELAGPKVREFENLLEAKQLENSQLSERLNSKYTELQNLSKDIEHLYMENTELSKKNKESTEKIREIQVKHNETLLHLDQLKLQGLDPSQAKPSAELANVQLELSRSKRNMDALSQELANSINCLSEQNEKFKQKKSHFKSLICELQRKLDEKASSQQLPFEPLEGIHQKLPLLCNLLSYLSTSADSVDPAELRELLTSSVDLANSLKTIVQSYYEADSNESSLFKPSVSEEHSSLQPPSLTGTNFGMIIAEFNEKQIQKGVAQYYRKEF